MMRALTTTAVLLCLALPLPSFAVPVIDPGVPDANGPDTTDAAPVTPNGLVISGAMWAADDFEFTMGQQLARVTFWAYRQTGAVWGSDPGNPSNMLNFRIAIDDGGVPDLDPYVDPDGTVAEGNIRVREESIGTTIYPISGADYQLVEYSFDLGGLGVAPATTYWLVLNAGTFTGGDDPGATDLLWAVNDQTNGAALIAFNDTSWTVGVGSARGAAFQFQAPLPATLPLLAAGLVGFGVLRRSEIASKRGSAQS
jgi:hypothetical protein